MTKLEVRVHVKAGKYDIRKPSTCRATLFRCKFSSMFPVFHLERSTCPATKTFVAGWRKVLRKVERWSTLSNKFWLCCSFFIKLTTCHATNATILDPHQANQPISALHFFNKFCCTTGWSRKVKNAKHRPKTWNETMLRDKLRVFVSRISPPLGSLERVRRIQWGKTFVA